MKPIRIFGLALVAALATMAFLGAGTASAKNVALCKEKVGICPGAQQYGPGTPIKAVNQEQGKLKAEGFFGDAVLSCQVSEIEGRIKATQNNEQVKGEITSAIWTGCKKVDPTTQNEIEACTVEAVQLPWQAHVEQNEAQDQNGKMWIGPGPSALQPGVKVDCPGLLQDGTFKAKETQPQDQEQVYGPEWIQMQITGGGGAGEEAPKATANQQELKGPLGVQGFWDAQYKMVEPATPLYVTQQ